jgi:hypothetical protein
MTRAGGAVARVRAGGRARTCAAANEPTPSEEGVSGGAVGVRAGGTPTAQRPIRAGLPPNRLSCEEL